MNLVFFKRNNHENDSNEWDKIEKALTHKYIQKIPSNNPKRPWNYIYPKDLLHPLKALMSIFGVSEKKLNDDYEKNNIKQDFNCDKNTFAQHVLEYFRNKGKWNKFFSEKSNRDATKTPTKENKPKAEDKSKPTGERKGAAKVMKDGFKANRSLMRKVWAIYNPVESTKADIADKVEDAGHSAEVKDAVKDAIAKVNTYKVGNIYGNNNVSGVYAGDNKIEVTYSKDGSYNVGDLIAVQDDFGFRGKKSGYVSPLTNAKDEEPKVEEKTETTTTKESNPAEEHQNRSEAMMGNDNAKKDGVKLEEDKTEFKELVDKYNELQKEFTSNGGYSNRRTTKEQDEKRIAARKGIREIEEKLKDFRERIKEENKGSNAIPGVYVDTVNEWLKRKLKGQTVSDEWLRKKFGGYYSDELVFGNDYSFLPSNTEDVNNPSVRINYEEFGSPSYINVDIGKMNEDQYRPRYMPQNSEKFTEVYKKFDELRTMINAAEGDSPAEKFYNTILGTTANVYNESKTETANTPRFRFTKDGIKDKNGTLEKIDARVRNEGEPDEHITLYADDYGASIPSIFYPENETDSQTDYFEKDHCDVYPDHPYYNHLKLMALKRELYSSRATKWNKLPKEKQDEIEQKIKILDNSLVEPTDEELKDYSERRDDEEEAKEKWKNAQRRVYDKQMQERADKQKEEARKKLNEVLNKFAEAIAKEPPVILDGLSKQEKIETLENRIFKLGMEINNLKDEETVESKKKYREKLMNRLEEVKNEPDDDPNVYWIQDSNGNRITDSDAKERIKDNLKYVSDALDSLETKMFTTDTRIATEANNNAFLNDSKELMDKLNPEDRKEFESEYEKLLNRSNAMKGNDNAAGFHIVKPNENVSAADVVKQKKKDLEDVEAQRGEIGGFEFDAKKKKAEDELKDAEWNLKNENDSVVTPRPKIDADVARRINDISMSGHSGEVYQHDIDLEMTEFRDMFDTSKMNEQQKAYFQERLNSYASLVGSSYGEMASKRLSAGPSWAVAGPAKYNTKRFQQKMDSERRAYETFVEKKDKFIKNTQKQLKELKYKGASDNPDEIKQKVFDDYSRGNYGYGDKIDNTDPYAIEKVSGKIKFLEDAHDVTLMYGKICKKYGLTNVTWTDRTDEDKANRKLAIKETMDAAKEKGISNEAIKDGLEHPFTQNQNAEIRRNKQRLEELQKRQAVIDAKNNDSNESGSSGSTGKVDFDGGYVFENPEMDRIQIIYDGKPERDVIDKLKHNGFRWSPSQGAWQRQLNRNGRMAVNRVFAETGIDTKIDIDGAGEVKKSLPVFAIKGGRFLVRI